MPVIKKGYHDRLKVFKRHGYDMMKARAFVISESGIKGGDVLEVGTGKGHLAIGLAKRGIRFTTIDLDKKTLNIARHNLKECGVLSYVCIKRMNAEKLRFKDSAFDHIISVNFIHHAKRPKQCIKEMVRVARHSIVIADLNKRGEAIMDKVHKLDSRKHEKSRMSLNGIKEFLEKSGLRVKVYRDTCQTVFVAKKGGSREDLYPNRNEQR
jgi:ubiquinone/menaquinone biosynthesis C-methylase UbiE